MHGTEDSVERVLSAEALVEASGSVLAVASVSSAGLMETSDSEIPIPWTRQGSVASEGLALMAGSELAAS